MQYIWYQEKTPIKVNMIRVYTIFSLLYLFIGSIQGFSKGTPLPSEKRFPGITGAIMQHALSQEHAIQLAPEAKCGICFEHKPQLSFVKLSCSHEFCRECLSRMATVHTKGREKDINSAKCPTCAKLFDITDMTTIFNGNNSTVKTFAALATKKALPLMPGIRQCPTPSCSQVFENEQNLTHSMVCLECNKQYCANCLIDHLNTKTCVQAKKEDDEKNEHWLKANTKPCPKCNVNIEKNEGCKHMTCKHCMHEFYWCCLQPYDRRIGIGSGHTCAKKPEPVHPPQTASQSVPLPRYDQPAPRLPAQNSHRTSSATQYAAQSQGERRNIPPQPSAQRESEQRNARQHTQVQPPQDAAAQELEQVNQAAALYTAANFEARRRAMSESRQKSFAQYLQTYRNDYSNLSEILKAQHLIHRLCDFEEADRIRINEKISERWKAIPEKHRIFLRQKNRTYIQRRSPTEVQIANYVKKLLLKHDRKVRQASELYNQQNLRSRIAALNDHQNRVLTHALEQIKGIDPLGEAEHIMRLVTSIESDTRTPKEKAQDQYDEAHYDQRREALPIPKQSALRNFEKGNHARSLTPLSQSHFLIEMLLQVETEELTPKRKAKSTEGKKEPSCS